VVKDNEIPRGEVSIQSRICSSNSVLEMVAARKDCNNDQYLGAFGPRPAASLALIVVVDSRDMCVCPSCGKLRSLPRRL
jgi:hypothetical protein